MTSFLRFCTLCCDILKNFLDKELNKEKISVISQGEGNMLKQVHYNKAGLGTSSADSKCTLVTAVWILLGLFAIIAFFKGAIYSSVIGGVEAFCRYVQDSAGGLLYQLFWISSACVALYGFVVLGWFRIMTRITNVLLFIVLHEYVESIASIGLVRSLHDTMYTMLIPFYEAGCSMFTALFNIVFPLCYLVFFLILRFLSLPVIGLLFSIGCWFVESFITRLPDSMDIYRVMLDLRNYGELGKIPGRLENVFTEGWGYNFEFMPGFLQDFFDFFTYFIIMYICVGAFFKVCLFFSCYIQHGLSKYFTIDNDEAEELSRDENVMEVLHRSRRRHPFKMPLKISIRLSDSAFQNAFVTTRRSIYIDPKLTINKGILAHELGHVVHGDSIDNRVKNTFYLSLYVALFLALISGLKVMFDNILFFAIGLVVGGIVLSFFAFMIAVSNIMSSFFFCFSGKWEEIKADLYAVRLGYGYHLMHFFGDPDESFTDILFNRKRSYERRKAKVAFFDPHPSEKNRMLYIKLAVVILSHIPFTRYWRMKRSDGRDMY